MNTRTRAGGKTPGGDAGRADRRIWRTFSAYRIRHKPHLPRAIARRAASSYGRPSVACLALLASQHGEGGWRVWAIG